MPLEDRDIFMAICDKFVDQPIEFIMEQYEKAKRINIEIERRICSKPDTTIPVNDEIPEPVVEEEIEVEIPLPPKKKYPRKKMPVKPEDAITDTEIACCICGKRQQSLTAKHIASHDLTVAEYKQLCGYDPDQALMSRRRYEKSREIIKRAQQARIDKKAQMGDD